MRHCRKCHRNIVEPQEFLELSVSTWRHGVPSGRGGTFDIHLACFLDGIK